MKLCRLRITFLLPCLFFLQSSCGRDGASSLGSQPNSVKTVAQRFEAELQNQLQAELAEIKKEWDALHAPISAEQAMLREKKVETSYITFDDIDHWQMLGKRYAAGFATDNSLSAIYDLSYQNTASLPFIGRSILGTVGIGDINLRTLIDLVEKVIKSQDQTALSKLTESAEANFFLSRKDKLARVLVKLKELYGERDGTLPGKWWHYVKWKNPGFAGEDEPQAFKLSDIDFRGMLKNADQERFTKALADLQKAMELNEQVINPVQLLETFEYQHKEKGRYNLYFNPSQLHLAFDRHRPMKIVDLVHYENTFSLESARKLYKKAIKELIKLIPEPVTAGLLKYAVSRWFNLYEQQRSFHRYQAYASLNLANTTKVGPFASLSPEQLEKAAIYILSHEAGLFDLFFKSIDRDYWQNKLAKERSKVAKNAEWAQNEGLRIETLHPFYRLATRSSGSDYKKLFVFGGQYRIAGQPYLAIDYHRPHAVRVYRNIVFAIESILPFISIPIPLADFVLENLYKHLVIKDTNKGLDWDARLVSYLRHLQTSKRGDFSQEMQLLYDQRINPFELTLEEEKKFVRQSQNYLLLR